MLLRILDEFSYNSVQDLYHLGKLDLVTNSSEVFVDCLLPTNVVVGVWDQMHIKVLLRLWFCCLFRLCLKAEHALARSLLQGAH